MELGWEGRAVRDRGPGNYRVNMALGASGAVHMGSVVRCVPVRVQSVNTVPAANASCNTAVNGYCIPAVNGSCIPVVNGYCIPAVNGPCIPAKF